MSKKQWTPKEIRGQYDQRFVDAYLASKSSFYGAGHVDEGQRFILGSADFLDRRVLDLGCGAGEDISLYTRNGARSVYGVDASESMVEVAKSRVLEPMKVTRGLMSDLPFHDDFFDIVASRFALHYLEKEEKDPVFEEVYRVLKPDGLFVFTIRNPGLDPFLEQIERPGRENAIIRPLYTGVDVVTPTHRLGDYLSPTFLTLFDIQGYQEGNEAHDPRQDIPGHIGIAARK